MTIMALSHNHILCNIIQCRDGDKKMRDKRDTGAAWLSNTAQQHKQSGYGGWGRVDKGSRGGDGRRGSLTSVLWGELPHGCGKALVELVLAGDEGLADGLLPKTKHAWVSPHLVHKGFKQNPFAQIILLLLCLLHRLDRWTHPPRALDSWLRRLRIPQEAIDKVGTGEGRKDKGSWWLRVCLSISSVFFPVCVCCFFLNSYCSPLGAAVVFSLSLQERVLQEEKQRDRKEEEKQREKKRSALLFKSTFVWIFFSSRIVEKLPGSVVLFVV